MKASKREMHLHTCTLICCKHFECCRPRFYGYRVTVPCSTLGGEVGLELEGIHNGIVWNRKWCVSIREVDGRREDAIIDFTQSSMLIADEVLERRSGRLEDCL